MFVFLDCAADLTAARHLTLGLAVASPAVLALATPPPSRSIQHRPNTTASSHRRPDTLYLSPTSGKRITLLSLDDANEFVYSFEIPGNLRLFACRSVYPYSCNGSNIHMTKNTVIDIYLLLICNDILKIDIICALLAFHECALMRLEPNNNK